MPTVPLPEMPDLDSILEEAAKVQEEFMKECMGDETLKTGYPDEAARADICLAKWNERDGEAVEEVVEPAALEDTPAPGAAAEGASAEIGATGPDAETGGTGPAEPVPAQRSATTSPLVLIRRQEADLDVPQVRT